MPEESYLRITSKRVCEARKGAQDQVRGETPEASGRRGRLLPSEVNNDGGEEICKAYCRLYTRLIIYNRYRMTSSRKNDNTFSIFYTLGAR